MTPTAGGWSVERLFRLTRAEYYADFLITPPLTLYAAARLWPRADWSSPVAVVTGFAAWTLYEYALHRFVMHRRPMVRFHAMHHRDPLAYVAQHPALTLATYVALWATLGTAQSFVALGFSVGYVWYAVVHTLLHYAGADRFAPLRRLREHHDGHHAWGSRNFGITTTAWDRLFGTDLVGGRP